MHSTRLFDVPVRFLLNLHAGITAAIPNASVLLIFSVLLSSSTAPMSLAREGVNDLLELSSCDWVTVSPEVVVQRCTLALQKKGSLDQRTLGRIYELRADAYYLLNKSSEARADYNEAIKLSSTKTEVQLRVKRARVLDRDSAIAELQRVIKDHPNCAQAYAGLAYRAREREQYDTCIKYASKAIALDPDCGAAYLNRLAAFMRRHKYQSAVRDADKCIALRYEAGVDGTSTAYLQRGTALIFLQKPREALLDYQIALRLTPSEIAPVYGIWAAYYEMGRYHYAASIINKMDRIASDDFLVLQAKTLNQLALGGSKEGLKTAERAIKLHPEFGIAHLRRGNVLQSVGRYEQALKAYDKALIEVHSSERWLVLFSKAYLLASCPDPKCRDGRKAKVFASELVRTIEGATPQLLMLQAMSCAECAEFEKAVKLAKQSVLIAAPEFPWRAEYEERLKLFEKGKPYRLKAGSNVVDYTHP